LTIREYTYVDTHNPLGAKMLTISGYPPVRPIQLLRVGKNSIQSVISVFVLLAATPAVHGATMAEDAHPAPRLEASKDLNGASLPGIAVADEAMLVQ
jgi:hypothetical protein